MVPLLKKKESLKRFIRKLHENREPTSVKVLHVQKEFSPLIAECIACNEICGIGFHRENGRIRCVPLMIEEYNDMEKGLQGNIFGDCCVPFECCDVKIKFYHRSFWKHTDLLQLQQISDFANDPTEIIRKSLIIALRVLERSPYQLGVVCGPISTGGRSVDENLIIFNRTVYRLSQNMSLFNQMPFEPVFYKVHQMIERNVALCPDGNSSRFFIDHFYRKIFTDIKEWYPQFIDGWKHSKGANEEHVIFTELSSKITYLEENFHVSL